MKRPIPKAKRIVCPYCGTGQTTFLRFNYDVKCVSNKCKKRFELNELVFVSIYPPVTFKGPA